MAPISTDQLENIKQYRKHQILDVALKLFASLGYHETSMSRIAAEAGISKGLIYNYFSSKKSLLKTLLRRGVEEAYQDFDLNHDGVLSREEFLFFLRSFLVSLEQNRQFWRLYFSVLLQPSVFEMIQDDVMTMEGPFIKILYRYFNDQGYDDPEAEIELLGAILIGLAVNTNFPEFFKSKKLTSKILEMYTMNKNHSA